MLCYVMLFIALAVVICIRIVCNTFMRCLEYLAVSDSETSTREANVSAGAVYLLKERLRWFPRKEMDTSPRLSMPRIKERIWFLWEQILNLKNNSRNTNGHIPA